MQVGEYPTLRRTHGGNKVVLRNTINRHLCSSLPLQPTNQGSDQFQFNHEWEDRSDDCCPVLAPHDLWWVSSPNPSKSAHFILLSFKSDSLAIDLLLNGWWVWFCLKVWRPCCAKREARPSKGFAGRIWIAPTSVSQRAEAADTVKDFRCSSTACALLTAAVTEAVVMEAVVAVAVEVAVAAAAVERRCHRGRRQHWRRGLEGPEALHELLDSGR